MQFHEWWTEHIGHPPSDDTERAAFATSMLAWQAALVLSDAPPIQPAAIEAALKRVGSAETTHEDELLLRNRIGVADDTITLLGVQIEEFSYLATRLDADAAQAKEERPVPEGGLAMGGKMWKCPRCNFINGLKETRRECRSCGFPGEEKREWVLNPDPPEAETEAE